MLCQFATACRRTPIHQVSLPVLSHAACASMSTTTTMTTTTTTRDRGDRYGPMEWAQSSWIILSYPRDIVYTAAACRVSVWDAAAKCCLLRRTQLYSSLKHDQDLGRKFLDAVTSREGVEKLGGMSDTSAEGTTHSVMIDEQVAFANWINVYVCQWYNI